ncbi:MAG: helix-turn-helix transcriptional regulator [Clostridiales bacterium]|nr:helix-turn-helix transcriptional regulator [Clostridiales bacterium]
MKRTYTEKDIERLQDFLVAIRAAGGWSSESFGNMIGVSKSTISNMETNRVAMSKARYETIMAVLDKEIKKSKDGYLSTVVGLLADKNLSDEKLDVVKVFLIGAKMAKLPKNTILSSIKSITEK